MSHFTVLVVTDTPEQVPDALAPYHEFECTGVDDIYVEDIDKTEEYRKEFESGNRRRLRSPDGALHDPYDKKFYRDPTPEELREIGPLGGTGTTTVSGKRVSYTSGDFEDGRGYRTVVRAVPEDFTEVTVRNTDVSTLAEWIAEQYGERTLRIGDPLDLQGRHKYGYVLVDAFGRVERAVRRTNPNSHWDWWTVGGRWSGMLRVRPGEKGLKGEPGLMGSRYSDTGVDVCRAGDLDLDSMLAEARAQRQEAWDNAEASYNRAEAVSPTGRTLEQALARYGEVLKGFIAAMEDTANPAAGPLYKLIEENEEALALRDRLGRLDWEYGIRPEARNRQHYIDSAVPFSTFAVIKDGQWYEKGSMGWWGMVSDEKDENEWARQFSALIQDLPADKVLSIIDCHI